MADLFEARRRRETRKKHAQERSWDKTSTSNDGGAWSPRELRGRGQTHVTDACREVTSRCSLGAVRRLGANIGNPSCTHDRSPRSYLCITTVSSCVAGKFIALCCSRSYRRRLCCLRIGHVCASHYIDYIIDYIALSTSRPVPRPPLSPTPGILAAHSLRVPGHVFPRRDHQAL